MMYYVLLYLKCKYMFEACSHIFFPDFLNVLNQTLASEPHPSSFIQFGLTSCLYYDHKYVSN